MKDETRERIYNELLSLLMEAELAARNGKWMTCGTYAKNCMEKAYEYGNAEKLSSKTPDPEY